jgi:hypothetical protein
MAATATDVGGSITVSGTVNTTRAGTLATASSLVNIAEILTLAYGSSTGQENEVFSSRRTLAGGANETLDLAGVLTNDYGQTITFAKIKAIMIANRSDRKSSPTDASMTIGNATAPFIGPFDDGTATVTLEAGDVFFCTCRGAGWTVTGTTADGLKIVNNDGTDGLEYDIVIIGTST